MITDDDEDDDDNDDDHDDDDDADDMCNSACMAFAPQHANVQKLKNPRFNCALEPHNICVDMYNAQDQEKLIKLMVF